MCGATVLSLTRRLRMPITVNEYTHQALAIHCARSISGEDVVEGLASLLAAHGVPQPSRSDHGPEFVAAAVQRFLQTASVATLYVKPASPLENGDCESFHAKPLDE
jgi:putative transposase